MFRFVGNLIIQKEEAADTQIKRTEREIESGEEMGSESKHEGGVMQIPGASKKVVQNIKEIVNKNCTDAEIYSVLCDFNMDADAAVQNLLNQGYLNFSFECF